MKRRRKQTSLVPGAHPASKPSTHKQGVLRPPGSLGFQAMSSSVGKIQTTPAQNSTSQGSLSMCSPPAGADPLSHSEGALDLEYLAQQEAETLLALLTDT